MSTRTLVAPDRMSSSVLARFRAEAATYAAMQIAGKDILAAHGVDYTDSMAAWNRVRPNSELDARIGAAWRKAYRAALV